MDSNHKIPLKKVETAIVYKGRSPYIDETSLHWFEWSDEDQKFVDTNRVAALSDYIDQKTAEAAASATEAETAAQAAQTAQTAAEEASKTSQEAVAYVEAAKQEAVEAKTAAEAAAAEAETAKSGAAASADAALESATTAAEKAAEIVGEADKAAASATEAKAAQTGAEAAKAGADASATKAAESASASASSATASAGSATSASEAKAGAEAAKTGAETAQEAAEASAKSIQESAEQITENAEAITALKDDLTDLELNVCSDFGYSVTEHLSYESNQLPNPDGTFFTDSSTTQHWFGSGYVEIPTGVSSIKFCGINYNKTTITPIAFYDSNKAFISCYTNKTTFAPVEDMISVPSNAKYYYQSKYYAKGDSRNSNNYTIYQWNKNYDMESIKKSAELIGSESETYDESYFTDTKVYNADGTYFTLSNWYSSDFISCYGRESIQYDSYSYASDKYDVAYVAFFDSDKQYLSGLKSSEASPVQGEKKGTVAVPDGAYYVRAVKTGGNTPYIILNPTGFVADVDVFTKNLPLTNKMKICCIGDSLTQGVDIASHIIAESYPYFMGKYLNCDILNYGQKGRSSKTWWDNYKDYYTFDNTIDVVLIMFGTNGGCNTNTLSTDVEPYDSWEDYADTGVGCYCKLIEYIYEQTDNHAQIILLTPPYSTYTEAQEKLVIDTNPVIKAIAQRYSIPVIDILYESGMGKYNASIFRPHDGCHFNAKGYHKLGTFIGSKVKSMVSTFDLSDVYDDEYVDEA